MIFSGNYFSLFLGPIALKSGYLKNMNLLRIVVFHEELFPSKIGIDMLFWDY